VKICIVFVPLTRQGQAGATTIAAALAMGDDAANFSLSLSANPILSSSRVFSGLDNREKRYPSSEPAKFPLRVPHP
jgi:hypothetical protein